MMSLNFVASQLCGFLPSLLYKSRVVYPSFARSALNTVRAIQKHACRNLIAAPKLLFEIFDSHELTSSYDLSSLRFILSGSQIVAAELVDRAFARCHQLKHFSIIYGMTELLISNLFIISDPKNRKGASFPVGRPLPCMEHKVIDINTKEIVTKNKPGELYTRGFPVFNGYWNDPEKTKEAIDADGWLVV